MTENNQQHQVFTGRAVSRRTSRFVLFMDHAAKWIVLVGGLGAILAVLTVCLFLLWVAAPLFSSPSVRSAGEYASPWPESAKTLLHLEMDDFQILGWELFDDGEVCVFRVDNGAIVEKINISSGKTLTAASFSRNSSTGLLGFADGSVQIGQFGVVTEFRDADEMPEAMRKAPIGQAQNWENGAAVRIPNGQFRVHRFQWSAREPLLVADRSPIRLLSHSVRSSGLVFCALAENGRLTVDALEEQRNLLTGAVKYRKKEAKLPLTLAPGQGLPQYLLISGLGDAVYAAWKDGRLQRYDVRDMARPALAEEMDLVKESGAALTAMDWLLGQSTMITGDSLGRVRAWFKIRAPHEKTADGMKLVLAHDLPGLGAPVTSLSPLQRSRVVAAGYKDGSIRFFQATVDRRILEIAPPQTGEPVAALAMAKKENGLLAISPTYCRRWTVDLKYPEITFAALFRPVWYEGFEGPAYVWQSSSSTDDFEPKYSLVPLIFGTVKAALYSMLFGAPLAFLAAIYTSEFMRPRAKAAVKPIVEMMASLPSVVLGFLAALVFAPFIEKIVPAVILLFFALPLAFLIGAQLWQLMPCKWNLRLQRWRFLFIGFFMLLGFLAAFGFGPIVERMLFQGDIKAWLDRRAGSGEAGWAVILLPLCAMIVLFAAARWINPWLRSLSQEWNRSLRAAADAAKFLCCVLAALGLAAFSAFFLNAMGWDPRGAVIGSYEQRNALVVGFVMGFAIIPIIYAIAEDALSSVPDHLRSASLACGATPWQTARSVIIPSAMSGLFSALMIGLGRAVGETMIVLMAAGNTPILDWNLFSGFRTLSANIAVELPEAVRHSAHYRTLFLAALALFCMTFVLNTAAECVRLRFRKRAFEL